jgi:hypothetical protein
LKFRDASYRVRLYEECRLYEALSYRLYAVLLYR